MADETPPTDNPFPALPPAQALYQINQAIAAAEKAQRYRIGDRELYKGDLRWMYPERARLEKQVAAANRSRMRMRRVIPL